MTRVGLKAEAERCKERRRHLWLMAFMVHGSGLMVNNTQALTAVEQENRILACRRNIY